jgi:hypothetical protein
LSTKLNPIDQILKDNKIIEDHFQKEMRLFFILRQVNGFILVFTLLCFSTVFQTTTDLEELRALSTFLTAQSLLLVFAFLNLFLLMVIRFLIIGYCNTKVGAVIIQKGITGVTILTVGYVFEPQLTHLLATGPLDPLPSAHIYAYQKKAWGYSAKTSEDIFVAKSYLSLTGEPPILKEDGFVDLRATVAARNNFLAKVPAEVGEALRNGALFGAPKPPAVEEATPPQSDDFTGLLSWIFGK